MRSCNKYKEIVCANKEKCIFTVKRRKGRDVRVYW